MERDPLRVHGAWTFGSTRLPLYIVFQNLASGATIKEVTQWFEGVNEEQNQDRPGSRSPNAGRGQDYPGTATVKILLDHNVPHGLRGNLNDHVVHTANYPGWGELRNGDLLEAASNQGYDILITCDQGMRHEQDLSRYDVTL